MNEQATATFISKTMEARELLAAIQAKLDDHMDVTPDEVHWGHAGDATHVTESLREIAQFMRCEE